MKKLFTFFMLLLFSLSFTVLAGMSKEDCKKYVSQIEKCIAEQKDKDLNKKWRYCEGLALWNLLEEYKNNGFCFDDDECKEMILNDIKACEKDRNELYRKLLSK
ncbi:hypothetical protein [Persephonella sp.]